MKGIELRCITLARTSRAVPTQLKADISTIRFSAELPRNPARTISVTSLGSRANTFISALESQPQTPLTVDSTPAAAPSSMVSTLLLTPMSSVSLVP